MSAAITQSINPMFVITLAGVFAWLWIFLDRRGLQPSTPMKMGIAMVFLTLAYGILLLAVRAESRTVSASLGRVPAGVALHDYGATRLRFENGQLIMHGVLTELDWMRALAASASEPYQKTVRELRQRAEQRHEAARTAKTTDAASAVEVWEVRAMIPADAGEILPIAGWPEHEVDRRSVPKVHWDSATRTLSLTGTLSDRDEAQLLAAGADPQFRQALTAIYRQSSTSRVSIAWLFAFYLVLTIGELCLSPVGLSLVTKAAPPKYVGLFMGLWFFCTGFIANFTAHRIGGYWGTMTPSAYFTIFGIVGLAAAILMLMMLKRLKPMLHGVG
jgi:POT family proton-dependent oligopeptide transporter